VLPQILLVQRRQNSDNERKSRIVSRNDHLISAAGMWLKSFTKRSHKGRRLISPDFEHSAIRLGIYMKKQMVTGVLLSILILFSLSAVALVVIQNKGSDTLLDVAKTWAEEYQKIHADVKINAQGSSSGAGIAGLINGTVDIVNSSRAMKEKEIRLAKKRGRDPVQHIVGYDALAIYVHKNNPIKSLTFEDLSEIFGESGRTSRWTDLGVVVSGCPRQNILLIGRQNTSGTYTYFRKTVLGTQYYKWDMRSMLSPRDVVAEVEKNPCAIGYSSLVYDNSNLNAVCVGRNDRSGCAYPSLLTARDGSYPLSQPLYMYSGNKPVGVIKAYLDWVLSDEGQCILHTHGYAPVSDVRCD
jgi:phosphate transport system substrate-binding protein